MNPLLHRFATRTLATLALLAFGAVCTHVSPWERGHLADRTMRADRDPLAFEVRNSLDAFVFDRYDLNRFIVEGSNTLKTGNLLVFEHFGSIGRIIGDVVLHERQLDLAVFNQIDIGNGCAGALGAGIHTGNVLVEDFSHGAAQRIIHASRAACCNIDEHFLRGSRRRRSFFVSAAASGQKANNQHTYYEKRKRFFHVNPPDLHFIVT